MLLKEEMLLTKNLCGSSASLFLCGVLTAEKQRGRVYAEDELKLLIYFECRAGFEWQATAQH